MAACSFLPGERIAIGNQNYHIRRKFGDDGWQLENDRDGLFDNKLESELRLLWLEKKLKFVVSEFADFQGMDEIVEARIAKTFSDYPEALQDEAKRRYKYLRAYEASDKDDASKLEKVAKEFGDAKHPSYNTLRRWNIRFKESGGDLCCLIPEYFGRGNRKKRYSKEVVDIAMRELQKLHLSTDRYSLDETLSSVRNEIERENKGRKADKKLPKPGRKFLRRLVESIDAYERMRARYGKAAADKYFRASLESGERVAEPLLRIEIDHTVLDLIVVHPDSFLPLGRPTITVALDRCTRCVVGYYVSFEPPSYVQVMKCLAHAIKPKDYISTRYPEIQNPWTCWGLPQQVVVDNGMEFHSKDLEAAAFSLLIDVRYNPVAQPWWKGAVERFFRTVSKRLIHTIPGTTFSNIQEKGDCNSKKQAVVSMDVLDELLHTWICDVYHQTQHRSTLRTPASLWAELINPVHQKLPESAEALDISVSSVKTRTLFHYGIELNCLNYNSPELMTLRRRKGQQKFTVRWDRSDLGEIHVLDESTDRYIRVPCTWYNYASGVSLWLHNQIRKDANSREGKESETKLDEAKARLRDICKKALTSKKLSTRKGAARAEGGLEATPAKPEQKRKRFKPNTIDPAPEPKEVPDRPAWVDDDDEDDDVPDFDVKQRLDEHDCIEDQEG